MHNEVVNMHKYYAFMALYAYSKALYYATLEKAQIDGDIIPLVYFLTEAVERMKMQLGIKRSV